MSRNYWSTNPITLPPVDDTGNTILDYLTAVSLLANGPVHRHDSRPGSYCVSVRYYEGQAVHVGHDGHAVAATDFSIYNARSGWDAPIFWARTPIDAQRLAFDLTDHTERRRLYAEHRAKAYAEQTQGERERDWPPAMQEDGGPF